MRACARDGDNVLRERAATVLRGLGTVDGRLSVIEAPDQGAIDAQTWIFAGERALEQPAGVDPAQPAGRPRARTDGIGFQDCGRDRHPPARRSRRGGPDGGWARWSSARLWRPTRAPPPPRCSGSIILGLLVLAAVAALSRWLIDSALRPVARIAARGRRLGRPRSLPPVLRGGAPRRAELPGLGVRRPPLSPGPEPQA